MCKNEYLWSKGLRVITLPNDKIQDQSKLKAFADNNFNVALVVQFFLDKIENIVGKGENAGYQHFLLSPQCIQRTLSQVCSKSVLCGKQLSRHCSIQKTTSSMHPFHDRIQTSLLTHSHTMTPFDAPGKQAF